MKPGYKWDGEYYVWSLREMTAVDLHDDVKHYPPSVRTPRRTKRMVLPPGPLVFPLKEAWNKVNLTLAGKRASELGPAPDVMGVFACPPEFQEPEASRGVDADADLALGPREGTGDAAAIELAEDALDLKGGLGIEKNKNGVRCRRDTAGKLYPVDKYGKKVTSGATSKPDEAKEKAVQELGSGAPRSTGLIPAPSTPRPDELSPLGDCPPMMVDPYHVEEFDELFTGDI
eukprot:12043849-Heterocapsa_arctica.AAC.1